MNVPEGMAPNFGLLVSFGVLFIFFELSLLNFWPD